MELGCDHCELSHVNVFNPPSPHGSQSGHGSTSLADSFTHHRNSSGGFSSFMSELSESTLTQRGIGGSIGAGSIREVLFIQMKLYMQETLQEFVSARIEELDSPLWNASVCIGQQWVSFC